VIELDHESMSFHAKQVPGWNKRSSDN
jgi:hypothetical protein